jgi:hypothetical protein
VPNQKVAPWLTGLQFVTLLLTADLEATAETFRIEGHTPAGHLLIPPPPAFFVEGKEPPPLTRRERLQGVGDV